MIIIYILMFLMSFGGANISLISMNRGSYPKLNTFLVVDHIALMMYWLIKINMC